MFTRKTKIIATIGPATLDFSIFNNLLQAGVDYIRINTSYGDYEQYDRILMNLKRTKKETIKVIFDVKKLDTLAYCLSNNLTMIALSFTEQAKQIKEVKEKLPNAFVISKIESQKGVEDFNEILSVSEGIMIARGDLSKAESLEKIPPLQKEFTYKTLRKRKFLVTATEMLLSMVHNPKPEIAEVSDVANAVFDGSSAVMLSEETAIGKYPVEAVVYMRKTIEEAEVWKEKQNGFF